MSLILWLIRHGQTAINAGTWSNKPTETRLTFLGQEQAKKAAIQIEKQPDLIIISPLTRAKESAAFLLESWPRTPLSVWPIQEFIYLSPTVMQKLEPVQRKELIHSYWQKNDPFYCHDKSTESFSTFLKRVENFHLQLLNLQGFIAVIGHGQFFKAYQLGLEQGFKPSPNWMRMFRQKETSSPIKNGEILKIYLNNKEPLYRSDN